MREDDIKSDNPITLELGHVYAKLESLESEQKEIRKGLHSVEVRLAEGRRFPMPMYGILATLTLSILGAAFLLYSELKLNTAATSELPELKERLTSAFTGMRSAEQTKAAILEEHVRLRGVITGMEHECCRQTPILGEKIKNLENRIVGQGPEGWHRKDHDLYAQAIEERFKRIEERLYKK